jgi:hypothetical protein
MKTLIGLASFAVLTALAGGAPPARSALLIPGANGSDGAFAPTANTAVDLSLASTSAWDSPGDGDGVYDGSKWAVVFKYSSVNIPAGVTVTFLNHPSRAPVVWLVSGNVTIAGSVNLSAANLTVGSYVHTEPGPGGFRGGPGYKDAVAWGSGGFGIGGAPLAKDGSTWAACASYASSGFRNPGPLYGNPRLLPLVGGAGGSGSAAHSGHGGAAGGGAILIAATGTIAVNGSIVANGGSILAGWHSGAGAGGAVRLISETLTGNGSIQAIGGSQAQYGAAAGIGRIRIETLSVSGSLNASPQTDVVEPDDPVNIWPPAEVPAVRVVSVGGTAVPADPHARFDLGSADLSLADLASAEILLQTTRIDPAGTVQVRIAPKIGEPYWVNAVFQSGTVAQASWAALANLPDGFFAVQARAENPPQ